MQVSRAALDRWLESPLGVSLLAREQQVVEAATEQAFGVQFLQVGAWGPRDLFLPGVRTQRRALVAELGSGIRPDLVSLPAQLAVNADSVDAVLLPHTLEFAPDPHEVLREIERVLVPEGQVVVLGFEPWSLWGLRHRTTHAGFPPGLENLLTEGRLKDWLKLLGFEVLGVQRYFYTWPAARGQGTRLAQRIETYGQRWWPRVSGAYALRARRRVYTLTPVRPRWRVRRAVGGLVEPIS